MRLWESFLDIILPVRVQVREGNARLQARLERLEQIHQAQRPILALAKDAAGILESAELEGKRPTILRVPYARYFEVCIAGIAVAALRYDDPISKDGPFEMILLGLKVQASESDKLEVL